VKTRSSKIVGLLRLWLLLYRFDESVDPPKE